jgi:hypothetical protein
MSNAAAAVSGSTARSQLEHQEMSPEEERWLEEQLELQLIEAGLGDLCGDTLEDAHPAASELTPGEQAEFDAWIESQTRRSSAQVSASGASSAASSL